MVYLPKCPECKHYDYKTNTCAGFKNGIPQDADLVFDVRFLPNPFYIEELRPLTGNDAPIVDYLCSFPQTLEFLRLEQPLLDYLIPQYIAEGKSQLVISVGCTGGRHRSVYFAERLASGLKAAGYRVSLHHRDIEKDPRYSRVEDKKA